MIQLTKTEGWELHLGHKAEILGFHRERLWDADTCVEVNKYSSKLKARD